MIKLLPWPFVFESLEARRLFAAGDLDLSFGTRGVAVYGQLEHPVALAVEEGGTILVADAHGLALFYPDGSPVVSFGRGGHVDLGFAVGGMAVEPGGSIVVGGIAARSQWVVARLYSNGSADKTFGPDATGFAFAPLSGLGNTFGDLQVPVGLALQPDGLVVVGGYGYVPHASAPAVRLVRFEADGRVDAGFGDAGQVTFRPADSEFIGAVAGTLDLRPNGTIVVGGVTTTPATVVGFAGYFAFDAAGRPVPLDLGVNLALQTLTSQGTLTASAFRPDGSVVFGATGLQGAAVALPGRAAVPVRFNRTQPLSARIADLLAAPDGSILVAGSGFLGESQFLPGSEPVGATGGHQRFALARLNPDGTPDPTFGFGGTTTGRFAGGVDSTLDRLALTPAGDVLAAGTAGGRLFLARFEGGSHAPPGQRRPAAALLPADAPAAGARYARFDVLYSAEQAIDPAALDNGDLIVTGPHGFKARAVFDRTSRPAGGTPVEARYVFRAPRGRWDVSDNGRYGVTLRPGQVRDAAGRPAARRYLGSFAVSVARDGPADPGQPAAAVTFDGAFGATPRAGAIDAAPPKRSTREWDEWLLDGD